jgi:hypothetical protein
MLRFQILMAASMKVTALRDTVPRSNMTEVQLKGLSMSVCLSSSARWYSTYLTGDHCSTWVLNLRDRVSLFLWGAQNYMTGDHCSTEYSTYVTRGYSTWVLNLHDRVSLFIWGTQPACAPYRIQAVCVCVAGGGRERQQAGEGRHPGANGPAPAPAATSTRRCGGRTSIPGKCIQPQVCSISGNGSEFGGRNFTEADQSEDRNNDFQLRSQRICRLYFRFSRRRL